jgi:hypothetical protein
LKPHIARDVPATREAIDRTFGLRIGQLFVANPAVSEYKAVLLFPNTKVVVSGEVAIAAQCDIISEKEFGWTDASYQAIRQR